MKNTPRFIMPALLSIALAITPQLATAKELIAAHGDWRIFKTAPRGKTTCYIASAPIKQDGNYTKRSAPYALVTYVRNATDEVSVSSGYRYKKDHNTQVTIGTQTTPMFVKGELAWAYDAKSDRMLINQMIGGNKMMVKGTSWKDTRSTDTYSLKGFTDAYKGMKAACN